MTGVSPSVLAAIASFVLLSSGEAHTRISSSQTPSAGCVALPLPALHGAEGNATELAMALRDLVSTFLTGPSIRTVVLDARLAAQALEEAKQKDCGTVLTLTLTRKKAGAGGIGRLLGDAAGAAAWHVPSGGSTAGSAAVRTAAIAGTRAASSLASNTRARDELRLEYRLASGGDATLRQGKDSLKAKTDGEDLITPLVERMATVIAAAVTR
jgi:hypothetical protein